MIKNKNGVLLFLVLGNHASSHLRIFLIRIQHRAGGGIGMLTCGGIKVGKLLRSQASQKGLGDVIWAGCMICRVEVFPVLLLIKAKQLMIGCLKLNPVIHNCCSLEMVRGHVIARNPVYLIWQVHTSKGCSWKAKIRSDSWCFKCNSLIGRIFDSVKAAVNFFNKTLQHSPGSSGNGLGCICTYIYICCINRDAWFVSGWLNGSTIKYGQVTPRISCLPGLRHPFPCPCPFLCFFPFLSPYHRPFGVQG